MTERAGDNPVGDKRPDRLFAESDLLPISALQHLIYCPRQCALIHNEQIWEENRLTVEGRHLHDKAHDANRSETRSGVRITRGLPLRSMRYGLIGQADVVEFVFDNTSCSDGRGLVEGGFSTVRPVEYKRGRPKAHDADAVQLCAQALCLEEMLNLNEPISEGCLFYGKTRRHQLVVFDAALRERTHAMTQSLHALIRSGKTPLASYEPKKCDACSLIQRCMPKQLKARRSSASRFQAILTEAVRTPSGADA